MDKRYIIIDTPDSRAREKDYGSLIGKELYNPIFFTEVVSGFVQVEVGYPLAIVERWINLAHDSVVEAVTKPLDEVIQEAKERSL